MLNEAETIRRTVQSLEEQSHLPREIVLVNDGSTDTTGWVCQQLAAGSPRLHYLELPERGGKSVALNYGLGRVSTEVVVFIDADTTFDRDAMENLVRPLSRSRTRTMGKVEVEGKVEVVAVGGTLRVRNRHENLLTELQALEYGFSIFLARQAKAQLGTLPIISGAFGAFRTDAVRAVGGHDPGPGNDSDLTIDLRERGGQIEFAEDAICHTNVPVLLRALTRQRRRWNRNVVKNRLRKHANVLSPFSRNFSIRNVLSTLDPIATQVVCGWVWLVYLCQIALTYPQLLVAIMVCNWCLHVLLGGFQLGFLVLLSERPDEDRVGFLYLPAYPLYRTYLRLVMLFAQVEEVFTRSSRRDPFAPAKVQRVMPDW